MRLILALPALSAMSVAALDLDVIVVDRHASPVIDIPVKVERMGPGLARQLEDQLLDDLCFHIQEVPEEDREDFVWRTDGDGIARLQNLPDDRLLFIQAQRDGHAATITWDPASGEPAEPLLLLWDPDIPFAIPGQVVDWHGEPVGGAVVYLTLSPGPRWMPSGRWVDTYRPPGDRSHVIADAEGRFTIPANERQVGHSHWRTHAPQIQAAAPGHLTGYERLVGPLESVRLELGPALEVTGTFATGEAEEPILAIWVSASSLSHAWAHLRYGLRDFWGSAATDESGHLQIPAIVWGAVFAALEDHLPQSAWLMLVKPGVSMAVRQFSITDQPGQEVDLGHLTLEPFADLEATLVDSAGQPLAGVEVLWLMPSVGSVTQTVPPPNGLAQIVTNSRAAEERIPPPRWHTRTGPDGTFHLSPLPMGANRLLIGDHMVSVTVPSALSAEITLPWNSADTPDRCVP